MVAKTTATTINVKVPAAIDSKIVITGIVSLGPGAVAHRSAP